MKYLILGLAFATVYSTVIKGDEFKSPVLHKEEVDEYMAAFGGGKNEYTCPGLHETWSHCPPLCTATCHNPTPNCTMHLNKKFHSKCPPPQCICEPGYIRNCDYDCVPSIDCIQGNKSKKGCGKNKKVISEMETQIFENRGPHECHPHEVFMRCPSMCERTCENPEPKCHNKCDKHPRCQCKPDFYRNHRNICVPLHNCPHKPTPKSVQTTPKPISDSQKCKKNEIWLKCSSRCEPTCKDVIAARHKAMSAGRSCGPPMCECIQGFFRAENGECVSEKECYNMTEKPTTTTTTIRTTTEKKTPPPPVCERECHSGEECVRCPKHCEQECGKPFKHCILQCGPSKCHCKKGHFRFGKICVKLHECPIVTVKPTTTTTIRTTTEKKTPPPPVCERKCHSGEECVRCPKHCEQECGKPLKHCILQCGPSKCHCKKGHFRFGKICVKLHECPIVTVKPTTTTTIRTTTEKKTPPPPVCERKCNSGEECVRCPKHCEQECGKPFKHCILQCGPSKCHCKKGHFRFGKICVKLHECPIVTVKPTTTTTIRTTTEKKTPPPPFCKERCHENEECLRCTKHCEQECGKPYKSCKLDCGPSKCYCKKGFLRLGNICVRQHECPVITPKPTTTTTTIRTTTTERCPVGEEWKKCASKCESTCEKPISICTKECTKPKCQCKSGFSRYGKICIPTHTCPRRTTPVPLKTTTKSVVCGINEIYLFCSSNCRPSCRELRHKNDSKNKRQECNDKVLRACQAPKCDCIQGFFRNDDGVCVREEDCYKKTTPHHPSKPVPPKKKRHGHGNCPRNEEFSSCPRDCEPECGVVRKNCTLICGKPKCICSEGYFRLNGVCIPFDECPKATTTPPKPFSCKDIPSEIKTCLNLPINYTCGKNEEFRCCGSREEYNCFHLLMELQPTKHKRCGPSKCECKPGFYRSVGGRCIPKIHCKKAFIDSYHAFVVKNN